ncbi:MAG: DUF1987 family protein [Flavobacteriales bacterium]|nr:DUF1987 family protein [Flavobacteriales bacterium]
MSTLEDIAIVPAYRSVYAIGIESETIDHSNEPYIEMDAVKRRFIIKGSSYPKHPKKFFSHVFLWMEIYSLSPLPSQELSVHLTAFNTASALLFIKLFEMWLSLAVGNTIGWYYETQGDEMYESGMEFYAMIGDRLVLKKKEAPFDRASLSFYAN